MIDYSHLMQVGTHASSSAFTSVHGFCLWRWSGTAWTVVEDHSVKGGVRQEPSHPGGFAGQLRSVASRSGDACDGK